MKLTELDAWFRSFLDMEEFRRADPSSNGVQVENSGADIQKVAFAVDACQETIERAAAAGAGMLFVHHGLFWGHPLTVTGSHYRRIASLLRHDMALYACHLPLDANNPYGNNFGLGEQIGLTSLEPFGEWRHAVIGVKGQFIQSVTIDEVIRRLFPDGTKPLTVLPFGPAAVKTAGIISGGGGDEAEQAIEQRLDLYITGEISHEVYHMALENGITVIAGGHYRTETIGVRRIAEKLSGETGIETLFIDLPTGM
jgi:dinuclear metal center YbgI/SA1388 family protein